ncbi:glutamate--tRNA ligase [Salinisphaera sp. USBA-960]|nr:glutamate--tRNA ligase [Salifodinibacter halophilus]NNC26824.1 glutamate--tRNA ligase [Salifodinibacter halophilus]
MATVARFAPSPTGMLHVGGARTALYSWLHARQRNGRLVLRIEDTDRTRSTPEAIEAIFDALHWLGLDYEQPAVFQSERETRHREAINQLLAQGDAYYCYASEEEVEAMRERARALGNKPRYDGTWRPAPGKTLPEPPPNVAPVVRFANPQSGTVHFSDSIRGEVAIDNTELDDLVIARGDGTPTYNLCVVVDDLDAGVTDIIRGDDHVNNTPRQINIARALAGAETELPRYAHVPMILGADGARLSKRHGAVDVLTFRRDGILPAALLNYLARLGWSYGDQELFSVDELVDKFTLETVQAKAAVFDPDKLAWVNQEHIKTADPAALTDELAWHLRVFGVTDVDQTRLAEIAAVQQKRARTMQDMARDSLYLFQPVAAYDDKAVRKHIRTGTAAVLADLRERLMALADWHADALGATVQAVAGDHEIGMGKVAQPLRIALTGTPVSPPIDQTLALLERETALTRLDDAVAAFADDSDETGNA